MATKRFQPAGYKKPAPATRRATLGPSWSRASTPGYTAPPGGLPGQPGTAAPGAGGGAVPTPPDATYEAGRIAAGRRQGLGVAAYAGERARGLSDYGFTETAFDPTKYDPSNPQTQGTLAFDPNNPRSKAALLKQTYDTNRRGTGLQQAASGGLYAGSYQDRQDLLNRGQLGAEDTLYKSLGEFLARNTIGAAGTGTTYFDELAGLEGDRAARATSSPLYEPTPQAAAAAPGATKATASVGRPQKTVNGQRFYQRASDKKWIPF